MCRAKLYAQLANRDATSLHFAVKYLHFMFFIWAPKLKVCDTNVLMIDGLPINAV
jgi:hypothetical protein